ncbi:MAG: SGNH/GDSL hydrolase family protein [Verrucomicrobiota bacterium]
MHVVEANDLLGRDGEGTADGIHAADLGFLRIADVLTPVLAGLIQKYSSQSVKHSACIFLCPQPCLLERRLSIVS